MTKKRKKGNSLKFIPKNYIVIDIETTGLNLNDNEIIEIGALKVSNNEIVDKFSSLVKPKKFAVIDGEKKYIDDFIMQLTGISNDDLNSAPGIKNVLEEFLDFIGKDILAGHNIDCFDLNFLYDAFQHNLNYTLDNDYVDSIKISRKLFPNFPNHKLKTLCNEFNIKHTPTHRAIQDCKSTFYCLNEIKNYCKDNNISIEKLFKKRKTKKHEQNLIPKTNFSTDFDKDNFFYNKNIVLTGKLKHYERKKASQILINLGANVQRNVTKKTDILIIGSFEYVNNIKGNKTSKQKKAERYKLNGQDIDILNEETFYNLINENNEK